MSWEIINEHREKARQISFDILVWGPSIEDSEGYNLRLLIKNHLAQNGHSAKFSEELIEEGRKLSAPDPVIDEIFHADAANIIIVLYGSRGTQTEFDRILKYGKFARKSVVVVKESMWSSIMKSLSASNWSKFSGEILKLPDKDFVPTNVCQELDKLIVNFQFTEYYRRLNATLLES